MSRAAGLQKLLGEGYLKGGDLGADLPFLIRQDILFSHFSFLSSNTGLLPSLRYQAFDLIKGSETIPSFIYHKNTNLLQVRAPIYLENPRCSKELETILKFHIILLSLTLDESRLFLGSFKTPPKRNIRTISF